MQTLMEERQALKAATKRATELEAAVKRMQELVSSCHSPVQAFGSIRSLRACFLVAQLVPHPAGP